MDGNLYEFLNQDSYPKIISKQLDTISSEWGHGCAVLIPGFNDFDAKNYSFWTIVSKVAAYNFSAAIHRGDLTVEVKAPEGKQTLNKDSLPGILDEDQDRQRGFRSGSLFEGLRPSGHNAYSALKVMTDAELEPISVGEDIAHVSLLTPSPIGQNRVELFRNGMWITDNIPTMRRADFASYQPFPCRHRNQSKRRRETPPPRSKS